MVSGVGFGRLVPRHPAHSPHSSGIWCLLTGLDDSRFRRRRPFIYTANRHRVSPELSGHAFAYRWRSLPRVRRHRASSPQGSSSNGWFRFHHGPINMRLSSPIPTIRMKWPCAVKKASKTSTGTVFTMRKRFLRKRRNDESYYGCMVYISYGVWCIYQMMYGVCIKWCMVYVSNGVWCIYQMVYGVCIKWCMVYISNGVWCIYQMVYGVYINWCIYTYIYPSRGTMSLRRRRRVGGAMSFSRERKKR